MRNENPLVKLADTGHRGQKSAEPMSGLNPDAIDEERSGMVCRTMSAAERLRQLIVRISWMDRKKEKEHARN